MPIPEKESQIPVGSQFSPDLIDLRAFIDMCVAHSGDKEALRNAVTEFPVRIKPYDKDPTPRQRMLPLEAAAQYGLLTPLTYESTELARTLAEVQAPQELYEAFARHILLNLAGLRVVEAVQEMQQDRVIVTGDSLARYLTQQGFRVTEHNTAINTMRMWLATSGLFPGGRRNAWVIDTETKKRLVGLSDDMIAALSKLTPNQVGFVKALCRLEPTDWIAAADVRDLAELDPAVRMERSSLPNEILKPLAAIGIIEFETGGTSSGKTSRLRTTPQFDKDILEPFLETTIRDLDPVLTAYYRTRPQDIYAALESSDTTIKGWALEAYTILVMRLLGLRFLAWRKRAAQQTGNSEVDVLMAGLFGFMPTTWQIQCKNTPGTSFRVEDIAKEVGLLPLTGATHILVVANAPITRDARGFSQEIMLKSSVTIFLLDINDFKAIKANPAEMSRILQSKAEEIHRLHLRPRLWSATGWSEQVK